MFAKFLALLLSYPLMRGKSLVQAEGFRVGVWGLGFIRVFRSFRSFRV